MTPVVMYQEVIGVFLCECGEPTDFEDCMLPANVLCEHCGKFWIVGQPEITEQEVKR